MRGLRVMRRAGVSDLQLGEEVKGLGGQDLGTGQAASACFAKFRKKYEVDAFLCPCAFLWRGDAGC